MCIRDSFREGFPPLAPPAPADQDPQLGVPAVREVGVRIEVVQTVVALLVAVRLALEHRVLGQVAQLERQLLVDLFRLGAGQIVVSHSRPAYRTYSPDMD